MSHLRLFFLLMICTVLVLACDSNVSPSTQAYPVSTAAQPLPPTVTPNPKMGSVKGVLIDKQDGSLKPRVNANLYLGEMKKDGSGKEVAAAYDRTSSPRAGTDDQGRFMFNNVTPGRYALILDLVTNSFMLNKPQDGSDMIVTVTAGQTVDLGTLQYDTPLPRP